MKNSRVNLTAVILTASIFLVLPSRLSSQAEPYEGWRSVETPHFTFVFEPKDRAAAAELVTFAEDVYTSVTSYFGRYPEHITVTLNGRTDSANGFFSPMPNRISLFIASPSTAFLGSRLENWLKAVLTHELTHYLHLTDTRGFFGSLSVVMGEILQIGNQFFLPGWMVEGITTDRETEYTQGGRGRDEFFEMMYKAPILENRLFSEGQAAYPSSYPPSGRIYVAGYILVNYLNEVYGDDTFARIHKNFIDFPFFGPGGAIKKVTGKSIREIFTDMKNYYSDRFGIDSGTESGKRVSPEGFGNYLNPVKTGSSIYVYRRTFDKPAALIRFDAETGTEEVVYRGPLFDSASFTVDSGERTLVFASSSTDYTHPAGGESISDLYRMDLKTGRTVRLTHNGHVYHPALSPDGTRLAAVQRTGSYMRLVNVDLSSGAISVLYSLEGAGIMNPVFSPDGTRIAFAMNIRGMQDIYLLDLNMGDDATASPVVTTDFAGDFFPRWKTDTALLFTSDREGDLYLYEADLENGKLKRILKDPVGVIMGVPSRDGILYESYSSYGYTLKFAGPELLHDIEMEIRQETVPEEIVLAELPNEKPYIDLPKIFLHMPSIDMLPWMDENGQTIQEPGLSFTLGAGSFLGYYNIMTSVSYFPESGSASAQLNYGSQFGPFSPSLVSTVTFRNIPLETFSVAALSEVSLGYTIMEFSDPFRYVSLTAASGIVHRVHTNVLYRKSQTLFYTAGLGFTWQIQGASTGIDPFTPGFMLNSTYAIPFWDSLESVSGFQTLTIMQAVFPGGPAHSFLKAGLKAAYQPSGTLSPFSLTLRGLNFSSEFELDGAVFQGAAIAALDWLYQFPPVDLPFLWVFNLTGIGMGVHLEREMGYGGGSIMPGRFVYPGIEFTVTVGYLSVLQATLGIGAAVAIDTQEPGSVFTSPNWSMYLFMGVDSFASGFPASEKVRHKAHGNRVIKEPKHLQ